MARFRKKPEEFEAEQFPGPASVGTDEPLPETIPGVRFGARDATGERFPFVTTAHHQRVYLAVGDWVRKEQNGDGYYPIKPEIMRTIADRID